MCLAERATGAGNALLGRRLRDTHVCADELSTPRGRLVKERMGEQAVVFVRVNGCRTKI